MLRVNGPNLPSSPFTITIYSDTSKLNYTCPNPRYTADTQVACDFTQPGLPAIVGYDAVYVQWSTGLSLALNNRFDLWGQPDAPRIRAVTATGCGDPINSANLTLVGCHGGELLTLSGINFLAYSNFAMGMTPFSLSFYQLTNTWLRTVTLCAAFAVLSDTTAVCALPYVEDSPLLEYDTPFMAAMVNVTQAVVNNAGSQSNFIFLTFMQAGVPGAGEGSASSARGMTVAVSVVVGVVGLVAVVAVAVLLVRRRRKPPSPRADGEQERGWDVGSASAGWSRAPEGKEVELASA